MPWIKHPATQDGPVSLLRWLKYHIGSWMQEVGYRWEDNALFPDKEICQECGQRKRVGEICDHIPF